MEPASVRPIATWRFSAPTRSLVRPSETGNTPPEPMPARMRVANNSGNEVEIAPRMLASPSSARQKIISRALPNRSAAAPTNGCTIAKVKANTAAKLAAVAMLTPNSSATCGSTGSSARTERLAANVVSAMMLSTGGKRWSCGRSAVCGISPLLVLGIFGERVECHQLLQQSLKFAQRHHVGTVGRRMIGIGMGLDEHAGNADGDRRASQDGDEFTLAAGRGAFAAGLLHGMRGVEDHRRAGSARQDRQRAHVRHQRVVAKRCAALGYQHLRV